MDKHKIDYVLVLDENQLLDSRTSQFLRILQMNGLDCQITQSISKKVYFVLIYIPPKILVQMADLYSVDMENAGHLFMPTHLHCNFLSTPFSDSKWCYQRKNKQACNMERILIAHTVLEDTQFADERSMSGLTVLIEMNGIKSAYPLHDGPFEIDANVDSTLNDRQILAKYWSNFNCWHKTQPLNLIQKYFGSQVAFYFAWLGFYNKMLLPAATLGTVCFFIGVFRMLTSTHIQIIDICQSNMTICPICHAKDHCVFQKLYFYCMYAKLTFLFDNPATVSFAIFMSFWATVFLIRWKSYENMLKLRWNVDLIEIDTQIRLQYRLKAKTHKVSEFTGEAEPYRPAAQSLALLAVTYGSCALLIIVALSAVLGITIYRIVISSLTRYNHYKGNHDETNINFIIMVSSALIQVVFIKIFAQFYTPISVWLTKIENPRTQTEFDTSVIYKLFFLAFANNYSSLFYIAFLKGTFYHPEHDPSFVSFQTDICSPSGCVVPLSIQLGFLILLQSLARNLIISLKPFVLKAVKVCFKCKKRKKAKMESDLPPWEQDYKLQMSSSYEFVDEYMQMAIQYGFLTFFVAAFPLAPLCALINNTIELRLDAINLVKRSRRTVPKQMCGIGPWNDILSGLTAISVATNAFVIAFTSDFVMRQWYKYKHNGSLNGFMASLMSEYDVADHFISSTPNATAHHLDNATVCHYRANRYPPNHPQEYQLNSYFWYEMGVRLAAVLVFEHLIFVLKGVLLFYLPKMPHSIKEYLNFKRNEEMDLKLNVSGQNYL